MAKLQLLRNRLITSGIRIVQIIEQTAALTDHFQEPAARAVVFHVLLQMLGQFIDPLGEQSDLHIGRTRVALMHPKVGNRFGLSFHILQESESDNPANIGGVASRVKLFPWVNSSAFLGGVLTFSH